MFARKNVHRVQAFLMSVLMVTLMTFVITAINTGFNDGFISRWGKGLVIAWPIAFAIILHSDRWSTGAATCNSALPKGLKFFQKKRLTEGEIRIS